MNVCALCASLTLNRPGLLMSSVCVCVHIQVLSDAVPVNPDEVEALVRSPVEQPLWGAPGSSSGSESEPQEPAVAVSAAVA